VPLDEAEFRIIKTFSSLGGILKRKRKQREGLEPRKLNLALALICRYNIKKWRGEGSGRRSAHGEKEVPPLPTGKGCWHSLACERKRRVGVHSLLFRKGREHSYPPKRGNLLSRGKQAITKDTGRTPPSGRRKMPTISKKELFRPPQGGFGGFSGKISLLPSERDFSRSRFGVRGRVPGPSSIKEKQSPCSSGLAGRPERGGGGVSISYPAPSARKARIVLTCLK